MYSARNIVHIVNEHLFDIEKKLHDRDAERVFTEGNCGTMPSLYRETGVTVVPLHGVRCDDRFSHVMSAVDNPYIKPKVSIDITVAKKLQGSIYDITCKNEGTHETIDLRKWVRLEVPTQRELRQASCNYGCYHDPLIQVREALRVNETHAELRKKLSKFGMLHMQKNPETGLYMPNENYRQP